MIPGKYFNPKKYIAYIDRYLSIKRYNLIEVQQIEKAKFKKHGLDLDAGIERLNQGLALIGSDPFNHIEGTDSIHWVLLSCISLTDNADRIKRILEIGTFRGKTTALLAYLFPHSKIVTCDLPESDPILKTSYRRDTSDKLREYLETRNDRLKNPNIEFIEANSFFLLSQAKGSFDLAWIDGGHLFPEIAWDLCSVWHLTNPGGIIMCDDIYTHPKGGDNIYGNSDGFNALNYLKERTGIDVTYFLKRENPTWSSRECDRKFVALFRKPKTS